MTSARDEENHHQTRTKSKPLRLVVGVRPRPPACLGRSLEFRFELPAVSVLPARVHPSNILEGVPKVFLV